MNITSKIFLLAGTAMVSACTQSAIDMDAERAALRAAADAYHAAGESRVPGS